MSGSIKNVVDGSGQATVTELAASVTAATTVTATAGTTGRVEGKSRQ